MFIENDKNDINSGFRLNLFLYLIFNQSYNINLNICQSGKEEQLSGLVLKKK